MTDVSNRIVQKLWSYCNVLRDDGLSYQDYLEQLTFLLFLKMADERAALTRKEQSIPRGYRWADLASPQMEGVKLEQHYRDTLAKLGVQGGMLGIIFEKAQNKIQDPAKLRQLIVELIGKENWLSMSADVKGDAYEGLLERNAQDVKGGAGQYFTPRALIQAIVDCVQPAPGEVIIDPACGTGGFLLAVHDYLFKQHDLDRTAKRHLRFVFFDRKPGAKEPWTKKVWVYDLRTNKHFTLKTKRMTRADLDEFVGCYKPGARQKRKATWSEKNHEGRWRAFSYDEIVARDKVSLDLFWLRDESLEDSANLPDPNILAQEIADDLRSALGQIEDILGDLERRAAPPETL